MAGGAHFGCPKFTFDRISAISDRYATLIILEIFYKMAAVGHFGCPKFTFDRISDLPAILDVRNSLSMAFLAISDPYRS